MELIALNVIRIDGGTQSRAALNDAVVDEYAQVIRDGKDFPPVVVFQDGKNYWLADGFHRLHAYRQAGAVEIDVDVRHGTRRDAKRHSLSANGKHGLRRSIADKRAAVEMALADEEWGAWSDRQIAELCDVSHPFVGKVRADLTGNVSSDGRTYISKHGTVAKMDTAKIGKTAQPSTHKDASSEQTGGETGQRWSPEVQASIEAREARKQQPVVDEPSPQDRIAQLNAENEELREANQSYEAEISALKAEIKKFGDMRVQYESGGFEKVVADMSEQIRVLRRQVETESQEKVKNLRSMDFWRKEAFSLGYEEKDRIDIPGRTADA